MRNLPKALFKTLAILVFFFVVAAFLSHKMTTALWLTVFFLIFGLIGWLIT